MHEMPVVGIAVLGRVLTHRRDEDAITKRDVTDRPRLKQIGLGHADAPGEKIVVDISGKHIGFSSHARYALKTGLLQ